jgi:hypothetical protein
MYMNCGRSRTRWSARTAERSETLEELRRLTSILWDSVSDVIVISVRHTDKTTTISILPNHGGWRSPAPVSATEFRVDYRVYRQQRKQARLKCCLLYR